MRAHLEGDALVADVGRQQPQPHVPHVGQLVVLVPEDLRVRINASVGLGELRVTELGSVSESTAGSDVDDVVELGPPGDRTVELDVRVGLGNLEVRRVAS